MSAVIEKLWRKERLKAAFSTAHSIKILDLFAQNAQDKIICIKGNSRNKVLLSEESSSSEQLDWTSFPTLMLRLRIQG